jgi:hypothetical protein
MSKVSILKGGMVGSTLGDNPQDVSGKFSELTNMEFLDNVLRARDGRSYLNATKNLVPLAMWLDTYSTAQSLFFIAGKSLYRGVEGGDPVLVKADLLSSAWHFRFPVEKFRTFTLFGSPEGLFWHKTTTFGKAGVVAPTGACSAAAGASTGLTGTYKYVYTYVNSNNHESNPSPSVSVTVSNQDVALTNLPDTSGTTGATKKIYRTVAGGGLYLYVNTVVASATTYTDALVDTSLGVECATDNTPPPSGVIGICNAGSRVYLLDSDGITVWASKIDALTAEPNWEAYPTKLSMKIPVKASYDTLYGIFAIGSTVFVASNRNIFRLDGDPAQGTKVSRMDDFGLLSGFSWSYGNEGVYLLNHKRELIFIGADLNVTNIGLKGSKFLNAIAWVYSQNTATDAFYTSLVYVNERRKLLIDYPTSSTDTAFKSLCMNVDTQEFHFEDPGACYRIKENIGMWCFNEGNGTTTRGTAKEPSNALDLPYSVFPYTKTTASYYSPLQTTSLSSTAHYYTCNIKTFPFLISLRQPVYVAKAGIVLSPKASVWIHPTIKIITYVDDQLLYSRICDITKVADETTKTIYLPVGKFARSVKFEIYPAATDITAASGGVEIYDIWVDIKEAKNESHGQVQVSA